MKSNVDMKTGHDAPCWSGTWNHIWAASWQNQQCGCVPSKDSDQPGHLPSLIRVFAVRMKKPWVLSYLLSTQQRLWSDWADAQADLSLRWAHTQSVGFVMRRLIYHTFCFFNSVISWLSWFFSNSIWAASLQTQTYTQFMMTFIVQQRHNYTQTRKGPALLQALVSADIF